jgi:uncharacterized protein HemX
MSEETTGGRTSARRVEPARSGGRGLAVFATLVALGALSATLYPHFVRVTGAPANGAGDALDALRNEQARQAAEVKHLTEGIAAIDARAQNEPAAVPVNPTVAIPDRALKLAEAEYLLQAANDRVKVTGDARDALAMVLAAQALVDRIDDATLAGARDQLARDAAALREAASVDVDATYDRLQALAKSMPDLPARGKHFTPAAPVDGAQGTSMIWQKFLSLFQFRREGAAQRPPLGPDDATYLRLNLALMVQSAELALLRGDADAYRQSLETVRRWLDDYLDTTTPAVGQARAEIEQLLSVRIDRAQPDIGGSLAALRAVVGPPSSDATPAPAAPAPPAPTAPVTPAPATPAPADAVGAAP